MGKKWLSVLQLDDSTNPWLVKSEQVKPGDGEKVRWGLRSYVDKASDLELLPMN